MMVPVSYTHLVYSYSKGDNILGNLQWGLTVLKPVYSFDECNMTKGHFHEKDVYKRQARL